MPLKYLCFTPYVITPAPSSTTKIFSHLFLPIQILHLFISRELVVRFALPHSAKTKVFIKVICIDPPSLCFKCSCVSLGLCRFSSCSLQHPFCEQHVSETSVERDLWSYCPRHHCLEQYILLSPGLQKKLNRSFPELHLYDYSIWIAKGTTAKIPHTHISHKMRTMYFYLKQTNKQIIHR